MHLFDARAKPELHAFFPLGFFIQADKVYVSVAQETKVTEINKMVFHKCLALLFDERYRNAAYLFFFLTLHDFLRKQLVFPFHAHQLRQLSHRVPTEAFLSAPQWEHGIRDSHAY